MTEALAFRCYFVATIPNQLKLWKRFTKKLKKSEVPEITIVEVAEALSLLVKATYYIKVVAIFHQAIVQAAIGEAFATIKSDWVEQPLAGIQKYKFHISVVISLSKET